MGTYIIGDTHGCYTELMQLIDKIEKEDSDATFILVGDIVDRGTETYQLVKWAMENITSDGKYQMIIGNHEKEKIDWINTNTEYIKHNTKEELNSINIVKNYPDRYDLFEQINVATHSEQETCDFIMEFVKWAEKLQYIKDITINNQRFIIVHANIPYYLINEDFTINYEEIDRASEFIVWDRDIDGFGKIPDAILVHGHTPTILPEAYPYYFKMKDRLNNYGRIVHTSNRYNIDCGIVYKNYDKKANLAALRLDDLKEFYLYE